MNDEHRFYPMLNDLVSKLSNAHCEVTKEYRTEILTLEDRLRVEAMYNEKCRQALVDIGEKLKKAEAPQFTEDEINLMREWYNHIHTISNPAYLLQKDVDLGKKIHDILGAEWYSGQGLKQNREGAET